MKPTLSTAAFSHTKSPRRRKPAVIDSRRAVVAPHRPKSRWPMALRQHVVPSPKPLVLCSLGSSRVSLQSVHTTCSTHHQRRRISAASEGEASPASAALEWVSHGSRTSASTSLRPLFCERDCLTSTPHIGTFSHGPRLYGRNPASSPLWALAHLPGGSSGPWAMNPARVPASLRG